MVKTLLLTEAGQQFVMYELDIKSSNKTYKVRVTEAPVNFTADGCFYLVDSSVRSIIDLSGVDPSKVMWVEGSEKTKTIEFCSEILQTLAVSGANKKTKLVAIGGGSIQDAATLTASLYMRGIAWTFVPTTFMAMTDSCIGGKSAINVGGFKNLAGNFYPPNEIVISGKFLNSLSKPAIAAGLLEAVKIQIARGQVDFRKFVELYIQYKKNQKIEILIEIAKLTLESKKWFVEIDEFDQKERKLLNYGHTFGHALESASGMTVPHGIAIGIGMLVANEISESFAYLEEINLIAYDILQNSQFNFSEMSVDKGLFFDSLKLDKKNTPGNQVLIILEKNCNLQVQTRTLAQGDLEFQWSELEGTIRKLGEFN
jgi:3-dehydroquinate synthase